MFIPTSVSEEKAKKRVLSYGLQGNTARRLFRKEVIYSDGSLGRMYKLSPVFIDSLDDVQQENLASSVASAVSVQGCDVQFVWRKKAVLPDLEYSLGIPIRLFIYCRRTEKMFLDMALNEELFSVSAEMWIRKSTQGALPEACLARLRSTKKRPCRHF